MLQDDLTAWLPWTRRAAEVPATEASRRRRAARKLWLVNLVLAMLLGTSYLGHLPPRASAASLAFAPVALASTMILLSLAPGLLLQAVASLPWPRSVAAAQGVIWSLFLLLLFADTRIFELFRYHFNGMVWDLLTTPGTGDSVELGTSAPVLLGLVVPAMAAAQAFLVQRWQRAAVTAELPAGLRARSAALVPLGLLLVVAADKAVYAWSDLAGHRGIESVSMLFPGYLRMTVRRIARTRLGAEIEHAGMDATEGGMLRYPLAPVALPAKGPRPNVLMIVVDSLRKDMLAPETMPNVVEWSQDARRFEDHLSTSNTTRWGVFGMLYGLPGTYWTPMLNDRRSPVLLDALEAAGYELRAFSSASLSSPELRSTCFASLCRRGSTARPGLSATMETDRPDERIEDALLHESKEGRDTLTGERVQIWLRGQARHDPRVPFFGFVLLDAAHQVYSYPPEHAIFQPASEGIDYLALSSHPDPEARTALLNRYRNAVHYTDAVIAGMLEALADAGFADDTLVIVTGDHGEEFGEHGFWGHTSNFADEQVRVPFVLRGPGIPPGAETRPTSHEDIAATILEACGLPASARSSWTTGENLLAPLEQRRRLMYGWERQAAWVPEGILWIPLAGHMGSVRLYDHHWVEQDEEDEERATAANADLLLAMARANRRFFH